MRLATAQAMRRMLALTAMLVAAGSPGGRVLAQDASGPSAKEQERQKLEEMRRTVQGFQFTVIDAQGKETPATMSPEPLLHWTDPTREFSGGALWTWRESGRPVAILGIELYHAWSLEFVSLTTDRIRADDGQTRWSPTTPGVSFREIPDAPDPAASEAGRLRQIRELARRFSAREFWGERHHALRLLPQPIDRYADAASGLDDGAIFIYANGTNPEVLLLIEAQRKGDAPPRWFFAAAPLGKADLHLSLGSREVWNFHDTVERKLRPDEPYYVKLVPRTPPRPVTSP